jgi:hypothetical protein
MAVPNGSGNMISLRAKSTGGKTVGVTATHGTKLTLTKPTRLSIKEAGFKRLSHSLLA